MTEPTDFAQDEHALPGLGDPPAALGANEAAARRTITALHGAGLVGEQEAVMLEALLTAARQLDRAATSGRAKDYGVAQLLTALRETYVVLLPDDQGGGDGSEWDKLVADLAEAERRAASLRDST